MIKFNNISSEKPFIIFKEKYDKAYQSGQKNIEAVSISTYNKESDIIDSRFVNIKFIENTDFIFFSNYNSPKSQAIRSHNQISALIYWPSINVQIRMKATIERTSVKYNEEYFKKRSFEKNALAISSDQSSSIDSYEDVKKNYTHVLNSADLRSCPNYWGGYKFSPYFFEFWEGHSSRLNKREAFEKEKNDWKYFILQP